MTPRLGRIALASGRRFPLACGSCQYLVTRRNVNNSEDDLSRTSSSLLRGAQADDQSAWVRLVDKYGPLVYHWCRRAGLQPADASDVVQEVLRSVARGLSAFHHDRSGDTFRGWLRRITQRRIMDRYRQDARFVGDAVGGSSGSDWLAQTAEQLDKEDTQGPDHARPAKAPSISLEVLNRVRAGFSERNWNIFWRVVVEQQEVSEVTQEFGVTSNVVRLAKSRILKRLRQELSSETTP